MKGSIVITHYGTIVSPGDVFMHSGEFLRLVYADTSQVTMRQSPFDQSREDNHYVRVSVQEALDQYGIRVTAHPEGV